MGKVVGEGGAREKQNYTVSVMLILFCDNFHVVCQNFMAHEKQNAF